MRIDDKGISIRTSAGGIATGCGGPGAGVTLPKVGTAYDRAGLAACAEAIKRLRPIESAAIVSASPETEYRAVIDAIDDLRGDPSSPLFPDVSFAP